MRRKHLTILLSVIVSFLFVVVYTYASTTISTNITTGGTLTVTGAVWATSTLQVTGVTTLYGNVAVDGGTFIFNDTSVDLDFRIESNGDENMLFVDGGANRVGIKTGTPNTELEVVGTASTTDIVIGGNSTNGTIAGLVFGDCDFTTGGDGRDLLGIAASSTIGVLCTSATGVRTGDSVFVQATSSMPINFVIVAATSSAANQIGLYIHNTGHPYTTIHATTSIKFISVR